ncbi:MAG: 5'-3' exonuclease H3TH domain-containing protein [Planctomycetaceae bacterium]
MTQVAFASLLGQVARSRSELPGHRSPSPTAFVGDELAAWRAAFGGPISTQPAYEITIEMQLVSTYEAGQRCARETSRVIENPWRADTPHHLAWRQGYEGKELAPCPSLMMRMNQTTDSSPVGAERPELTKLSSATADSVQVAAAPVISTAIAAEISASAIGTAEPTAMGAKTVSPTTMKASLPDSTKIQTTTSDQTTATPVDLVAIDFLNLLVRCFHVGTPSDVHGVRGLLICVAKLIRTLKPARVVFAAEGGYAHRTALLATYKEHRPPKSPELAAQIELAERALSAIGWPLIRVEGFEADDVLASLVSGTALAAGRSRETEPAASAVPLTSVAIISTDKDLLQLLPRCRVWNPFGEAGGWQTADTVRAKFGCELHQLGDWLALVGDSSDGIPGVAGIGEKTATKLLVEFGDIETAIAQAALGKISGALGAKLKSAECWSQIEQARKLLSLVETLDVFESLEKSAEIEQPRSGWESRLQALRLFVAIKPLAEAFESLSVRGDVSDSTRGTPTATRPPRLVAKSLF